MTNDDGPTSSGTRPGWLRNLPGLLGGTWLIAALAYILWTRVSYPSLSAIGKSIVAGVCLSGVAFATSAMWPFKGQELVQRGDMASFWSFVRGPAPTVPYKQALWRKMRRTIAIWLVVVFFMIVGFVAGVFGLLYR